MSIYRKHLPQLDHSIFVTDGGLETTLIYHERVDLPLFAAFDLLKTEEGVEILRRYYTKYADIARQRGVGFVLEAPTWRANADWAAQLGYDEVSLADANRKAIGLMLEIREEYASPTTPMVISGNLGPRGDGYRATARMNAAQARDYHTAQINTFAQTDADMVAALTLNYVEEAVGIVLAAQDNSMPVAISFTVETDGRLPGGDSLADAVQRTDEATHGYAAYYMINCAHPTHVETLLSDDGAWRQRIRGLRANASKRSHAELDNSNDLDAGNPLELGGQYRQLRRLMPHLTIVGGCCGTDHRHVEAICAAVA